MVDLHCHILPGIDDGAKTVEESLAMAESAIADGITRYFAEGGTSNVDAPPVPAPVTISSFHAPLMESI